MLLSYLRLLLILKFPKWKSENYRAILPTRAEYLHLLRFNILF